MTSPAHPQPNPATDHTDLDALPAATLLDALQTAQLLGTTTGTLEVWRCTGRHGLKYVKVGRRVRYRAGDLREWLAARTTTHTGALPTNVA